MQLTGPLEVDAARGRFHQFHVEGRQLIFPAHLFAGPRTLGKEGRKLFNRVCDLGGKGVTVTGEETTHFTRFTQDTMRPVTVIIIHDIAAHPAADPKTYKAMQDGRYPDEDEEEVQKARTAMDTEAAERRAVALGR